MAEDSQKSPSRTTKGTLRKIELYSIESVIRLPTKLSILLIRAYQLIVSPWVGNQCRFSPSCSHYAIDAYKEFGFWKGSWLSLRRLIKCNPWHEGGIDEIPQKKLGLDKSKKQKH